MTLPSQMGYTFKVSDVLIEAAASGNVLRCELVRNGEIGGVVGITPSRSAPTRSLRASEAFRRSSSRAATVCCPLRHALTFWRQAD
jgi:hypothetical protein